MIVYMFNIIWVVANAIFAERYSKRLNHEVLYKDNNKIPNLFFTVLILISLISLYALRWKTGTDFGNYYSFYFVYGNSTFESLFVTRDWGFSVLTKIIYNLWPGNYIFYNFILAVLTYVPVILVYRKYSNYFTFTMILYITLMIYYWPYNGVRQSIAASICFFGFPYLMRKKYLIYIALVIFASLFHSTALLLIPIMFLITQKAWSKSIWITSSILIVSFILLPNIWGYLINFLESIGQTKLANDYQNFDSKDDGANILRILVVLIPIIISLIFYKALKEKNSNIDLIINMSLMCGLFMIFSSQLTVLARLSNYFIFFQALLIPEFSKLFKPKLRVLFQYVTIALFFVYMILLLPVDSNLLPYRFIINELP